MNHTGVTSVGCRRQAFRKRLSSGVRGNRRLARLRRGGVGWRDEDRIPLELHPVGDDRERRGPPRTWPVSSEKTPSCHGQVTVQRAGSTVPSERLARAWVQRFAIACTVPRTLKSATASPPTYTRRLVPAGSSASVATGVYPSARVGRRAVAWADPAPPNVSSMSHRDICTHVKVGVSRSV